jgi:hypothetical protein
MMSSANYEDLLDRLMELKKAAEALYFAAHWHADRPVDESALWTALRDAARIEPGQTAARLGPDRSTAAPEAQEYICKCGVRVVPHKCATGENF